MKRAEYIRIGAMMLVLAAAGCQKPETVHVLRTTLTLPTYPWGPGNINPQFDLTPTGLSIYPYPMQDSLGPEKSDRSYDAMVLENEYLRVTVVPDLGSRILSVYDKAAGREMFYRNAVVKPGLIGLAGAWLSGGVEFNTGPSGHTVTTLYPVSCRFLEYPDGSKSIAMGHSERIYRTQWTVVIRLRPGRRYLEEQIRLYNPTSLQQSYYFWNNTAVPNTDGTQFIYPMTLGCDHSSEKFFQWPVNEGRDLSWSRNYDTPSSIFAYQCNQDFFGSYDHGVDYGLVSYANHHELPGKKAWTWGRGDDGVAAMATLTDDDTWYNEVQTGPLATQADFGTFAPHQTIEWTEWWYPVHAIQGFEYATRDVAVNVLPVVPYNEKSTLPPQTILIASTGSFPDAEVVVTKDCRIVARTSVQLSPSQPTRVDLAGLMKEPVPAPVRIDIHGGKRVLASFTHPLTLPKRKVPEARKAEESGAATFWKKGRKRANAGGFLGARESFEQAIQAEPALAGPYRDLALLDLKAGAYESAVARLEKVLSLDPNDGMAHYLLAEAALGLGDDQRSLDEAWQAAQLAGTISTGLNLAGQVYIRTQRWDRAIDALRRAVSRDSRDLSSHNALAIALDAAGQTDAAIGEAMNVLNRDPLDPHATATLVRIHAREKRSGIADSLAAELRQRLAREPQTVLEAAAFLLRLKRWDEMTATLQSAGGNGTPMTHYYLAYGCTADEKRQAELAARRQEEIKLAQSLPLDYEFPHRVEDIEVLGDIVKRDAADGRAWYLLGNALFARYRHDEGRKAWQQAAQCSFAYSVLYRNIALAKAELDKDWPGAAAEYEKARKLNPDDPILLRDLARAYRQMNQWDKMITLLEENQAKAATRGDVVEDLARAYEHVNQLDKAAALLETSRFNAWEGQQTMHDIYETVHLRLGEQAMERKDYAAAIRSFQRSLEYPRNLGSGKPIDKSQARNLFLLGQAYEASGRLDDAKKAWKQAADEKQRGGDFAQKAAAKLGLPTSAPTSQPK